MINQITIKCNFPVVLYDGSSLNENSRQMFMYFEAITNLMHTYLYSYIKTLYMLRALLYSSSGGSILYVQHLVLSLAVSGRTNLMHKYLYSYNITILYMFRALLCSSSGGSILYVQHLVPSLSMSGRTLQWLRENSLLSSR